MQVYQKFAIFCAKNSADFLQKTEVFCAKKQNIWRIIAANLTYKLRGYYQFFCQIKNGGPNSDSLNYGRPQILKKIPPWAASGPWAASWSPLFQINKKRVLDKKQNF